MGIWNRFHSSSCNGTIQPILSYCPFIVQLLLLNGSSPTDDVLQIQKNPWKGWEMVESDSGWQRNSTKEFHWWVGGMNDGRRSEMKYAESISIPFIDCGQISFIYTWKWFKIKYKTNIKSKLDPLVYFWTRVKSN